MRIFSFAIVSMVVVAPAFAQPYDHHHGFEDRQPNGWAAHADEQQSRRLARQAAQDSRHADRDAAVGDYHGAAHAEQRARAEEHGARSQAHDAQHDGWERHRNRHLDPN